MEVLWNEVQQWSKFTQILTNPLTIELKGVWLLAYPYIFTLE